MGLATSGDPEHPIVTVTSIIRPAIEARGGRNAVKRLQKQRLELIIVLIFHLLLIAVCVAQLQNSSAVSSKWCGQLG